MILVADSGSTKTEWRLADQNKSFSHRTNGLNIYYQSTEDILIELKKELVDKLQELPDQVYFYGAGCTPGEKTTLYQEMLSQLMPGIPIQVHSDMLGAARSLCQKSAGIACILGTGSNSCYYNGDVIEQQISPLGYMLGDEGSGSVLGKRFIVAYLRKQLPASVDQAFSEYNTQTRDQIMNSIYKQPYPNRYLASFTRFIFQHKDNPELNRLITRHFEDFFDKIIKHYKTAAQKPVHFAGSIGHFFRQEIIDAAQKEGFQVGHIEKDPIDKLIKFHLN